MASVTSLDQDMKRLRMGRYTPQAANEVRGWIEDALGERLPAGDLLDALKDGTVLCRLINLAVPVPGVKFKKSGMPFIQMENISHFLKACEMPPLKMPSHDRFLTVDLFEAKDPAQVLQCIVAFSRVANAINPATFPNCIGPKRGGPGATSPGLPSPSLVSSGYGRNKPSFASSTSGSSTFNPLARPPAERALSPARTGGSNTSKTSSGLPTSPLGGFSSWSKKGDEGVTSPAWNIHQYGYMGGASQGNQGVSFGARRQITTAGPSVPSAAEKEKRRKDKEGEDERLRVQAEEAEYKRRIERETDEERARIEEERSWEEESRKQREAKEERLEQQKREWEEQERQWKLDEEQRQRSEREAQAKIEAETRRKRAGSDARLRGQFLSQYQAEQTTPKPRSRRNSQSEDHHHHSSERDRIIELERQLEEAKERERQYQLERDGRIQDKKSRARSKSRVRGDRSRSRPRPPPRTPSLDDPDAAIPSRQDSQASWVQADDREYLRNQWETTTQRPLPSPTTSTSTSTSTSTTSRPLPDPALYAKQNTTPIAQSRTDRHLASHPAPLPPKPHTYTPQEITTSASERAAEDKRRVAAQQKTKAAGWASKSLLEREMERERERQKEWEDSQRGGQGEAVQSGMGWGGGGKRGGVEDVGRMAVDVEGGSGDEEETELDTEVELDGGVEVLGLGITSDVTDIIPAIMQTKPVTTHEEKAVQVDMRIEKKKDGWWEVVDLWDYHLMDLELEVDVGVEKDADKDLDAEKPVEKDDDKDAEKDVDKDANLVADLDVEKDAEKDLEADKDVDKDEDADKDAVKDAHKDLETEKDADVDVDIDTDTVSSTAE
ncbi:hypothetical protein P153DRAFT_430556 [Dothidotthia symphoricarpi CBS 119687]|uniref:Calponin-homology (CH) domain-containing protein n=1 Tax=Dothidotthia symphoricarpi CBS 119687 TaxID=1392245 RepID=A0A6A6AHF2_9PLEO|nr:uncharacterized protein P153DRAFT_430556 [Dothidotthia symphoricarpi CBS 119687]KAF2130317.1 hypothetical protein P153DRAFT_430556 [Dothidotthia symphoricarpi CBS 119687]